MLMKLNRYIIVSITKDADEIVDISITPLAFSDKVGAQYGDHNYHISGNRCDASHACEYHRSVPPFNYTQDGI